MYMYNFMIKRKMSDDEKKNIINDKLCYDYYNKIWQQYDAENYIVHESKYYLCAWCETTITDPGEYISPYCGYCDEKD